MCGIFAVFSPCQQAYNLLLTGITVLQHRGTDAAGIHCSDGTAVYKYKGLGKVERAFSNAVPLPGHFGIGHVRYCTAGNLQIESAQPLNHAGISLVHNGNLTNTDELTAMLESHNIFVDNPSSDSELLLRIFVLYYKRSRESAQNRIFDAVAMVMKLCAGSFSVVVLVPEIGMVAFRDPAGIRPLCFGESDDGSFAFASESVAVPEYERVRDVQAGECIIVGGAGISSSRFALVHKGPKPCLFEYIYFARPESVIDGVLVYQARKNMGEALANKILKNNLARDIDVVMPVPDSARISALKTAHILQVPYCEGLIKNNYIGRTFIMPSQTERKKTLKLKLNTIDQEFRNKTVLIVDDSIVRGNTSVQIINLVRKAGARRIIFASIAPPVRSPNVYGIAIPTYSELIAYGKSTEEICALLGADELIYNDLPDVIDACRRINPAITEFETSCFS
jgi:amidophosphoribosyltransferase